MFICNAGTMERLIHENEELKKEIIELKREKGMLDLIREITKESYEYETEMYYEVSHTDEFPGLYIIITSYDERDQALIDEIEKLFKAKIIEYTNGKKMIINCHNDWSEFADIIIALEGKGIYEKM